MVDLVKRADRPNNANAATSPSSTACRMSDSTMKVVGRVEDCSTADDRSCLAMSCASNLDATDKFDIDRYEQVSVVTSFGFLMIGFMYAVL